MKVEAIAAEGRLRLERVLPAPIEEVFTAWTNPESMARWLSPAGHAEVESDLRVSGYLRVVMIEGDVRIEHTGEYLEIEPPHLISFTWRSPYTGEHPSVVTVNLSAEGGDTRLVLVHERLPRDRVAPHAEGWGTILERLAAELHDGESRDPEPAIEEVTP